MPHPSKKTSRPNLGRALDALEQRLVHVITKAKLQQAENGWRGEDEAELLERTGDLFARVRYSANIRKADHAN